LVKIEAAILLLLLIASLGAVFFRRRQFPLTMYLVMVGSAPDLLVPWLMPWQNLVISPDLIIFLSAPPLILASASNLPNRLFFRNLTPIPILAGPGLVVSLLVIGVLLAWLPPLPWGAALRFVALILAAAPVAVVACFARLGVPARLKMLADGESLLHGATAIVAFTVIMGLIMSGSFQAGIPGQARVNVIPVLLGGALVGVLLGTLMRFATVEDATNPLVQFATPRVIASCSCLRRAMSPGV
jgi:monovalent cation:H+ antiporter, CPA1 family